MTESPTSAGEPATLPAFLEHLLGWYAMTMLLLGERTGLLAALKEQGGTVDEIARRSGAEARNTFGWLRAMVGARHATHAGGVFSMSPQLSAFLDGAFPVDVLAVIDFARRTAEVLPDVEAAIRSGEGIPAETFQAAYGKFMGHINTPTYQSALVEDWIGGTRDLTMRLREGGRIADIACADGDATLLMAEAFPRVEVVGFDLDMGAITTASQRARKAQVSNASFVAAAAHEIASHGSFDLAICLDSWHHLGDPVEIAQSVLNALRPGGTLLIVESGFSGDIDTDAASVMSLIGYAAALLYCLQESIAGGGTGLTPADGPDWVADSLTSAGFGSVEARMTRSGWRVFAATR